ncbi:MAG: OmpH family outer membrane protein, partial [Bacteroidales bacterium]|nr:OmpH family outer membrane protein [Bacteroidales bacterium]
MEDNQIIQNEVQNEINDCSCNTGEKKKCCCKCNTIVMVVLFIAVAVLYVLHFASKPNSQQQVANIAGGDGGGITIGYIDTDSLIDQYQYAVELNEKVKHFTNLDANYKAKAAKFQEDYNKYLQTGANMTLTEQKKNEESLKKRAEEIQRLENQLVVEQQKLENVITVEQKKMMDAVYAYIREYNASHDNFTVILKKSYSESPVLYMDSTLDITKPIIKGL